MSQPKPLNFNTLPPLPESVNEVHSWKKMYLKTLRLINYIELCSQVLQGQGKSKTKDTQVTAESQLLSPEVFPVYAKKKNISKMHKELVLSGLKNELILLGNCFLSTFYFFCSTPKIISKAALKGFNQFPLEKAKERD